MHIRPISMGASALVLALTMWGGSGAHAADGACTLSSAICAKEGVVLLAPHADPLTSWDKDTDFVAVDARAGEASYILDHLGSKLTATLLLGSADLVTRGYDQLIQKVVARGGTVIVTEPRRRDAKRLDRVADINGARWTGKESVRAYGLRQAVARDGHTYPTAFVLLFDDQGRGHGRAHPRRHHPGQADTESSEIDQTELTWLEGLIGRDPPTPTAEATASAAKSLATAAQSSNDLINLAQAKHTSVIVGDKDDVVQVDNFIYGARSFLNNEDLYYVDQEVKYSKGGISNALDNSSVSSTPEPFGLQSFANISLLQPSPQTTLKTVSYTTGVDVSIGGNIGYESGSGAGANVSAGATFSNSTTITVPPLDIKSQPTLTTGISRWIISENDNSGHNTILLNTSWIWVVPLATYRSEGQPFTFESVGRMRAGNLPKFGGFLVNTDFTAQVVSVVDQPFPTKTVLPPSVASVTPSSVPVAGQATIAGQGLYPGLFENVLLGGNALPAANVTNISDRQIIVTAPNDSKTFPLGKPLAVQVNTSAGASNQNNTLTILRRSTAEASLAQPASAPE